MDKNNEINDEDMDNNEDNNENEELDNEYNIEDEELDNKDNVEDTENEDAKKKKRKKILILLLLLLLIAIVLFFLSKNEPKIDINIGTLDFGSEEIQRQLEINNGAKKSFFHFRPVALEFNIEVTEGQNWISVYPETGTVGELGERFLVTIARDKLTLGGSSGTIRVASNGGVKNIDVLATRENDAITILAPSITELAVGSDVTMKWKASIGVSDSVNILLCQNECVVKTIARRYQFRSDNHSVGSFKWALDETLLPGGDKYTLRIEDAANDEIFDEVHPIEINYDLTEIHFKNVNAAHQAPCVVQYLFSLRDQYNHAVEIENTSRLNWNNLRIWENEKEIDYMESYPFLYPQDDFKMQIMLVLDFSVSMQQNANGIATMVKGAKSLIDSLKETHEIGVIEFHRPESEPSVVQRFITNKESAKMAIDKFISSEIYSDFSICWEAVYKGLEQFPEFPDPKVFRAMVFLSDGFDNSSTKQPAEILEIAKERNVHIYNIGVGDVHEEKVLKGLSADTGGTYVRAENICRLLERFNQIIKDLGGQYKLSYITPKKPNDGIFNVKFAINYNDVESDPPLIGKIDSASIYGKTSSGHITFSSSTSKNNETEIFMWCEHAPRYVHEFRFQINTTKPYNISLTSKKDGGLCEGWSLSEEEDGWFRITSPNPKDPKHHLPFGSFGTIFKIKAKDVFPNEVFMQFKLDNSIYNLGQTFYGDDKSRENYNGNWTKSVRIGS